MLLPNFDPVGLGVSGADQIPEAARRAEELGFESVWAEDQLACPAPGLDAPTCMAACAAVTERIALGFSAMQLGLRNPAWTAKQLASIDLLAGGGRLRLGVGAGREFPPALEDAGGCERGARLDDSLAVIGDLLTGRPVDYTGRALTVSAPALEPALPPSRRSMSAAAGSRRCVAPPATATPGCRSGSPRREIAERSQLLGEMALEQGRPDAADGGADLRPDRRRPRPRRRPGPRPRRRPVSDGTGGDRALGAAG